MIEATRIDTKRVLIDGAIYTLGDWTVVQSHPSIVDKIVANKKAIMGAFGSAMNLVVLVVIAVPDLAAMFPLGMKLFMAFAGAAGFIGAHASKPDTPAVPTLSSSLSLTPKESALIVQ